MNNRSPIWRLAAIFGFLAIGSAATMVSCKRSAGNSDLESRMFPIARALSFVSEADLATIGEIPVSNGKELEISPAQAATLVTRIQAKVPSRILLPLPAKLGMDRYRIVLRKVNDPSILRARAMEGFARPYYVTMYEDMASGSSNRTAKLSVVD